MERLYRAAHGAQEKVAQAAAAAQEKAAALGSGLDGSLGAAKKALSKEKCARCSEPYLSLRLEACRVCGAGICPACAVSLPVPACLDEKAAAEGGSSSSSSLFRRTEGKVCGGGGGGGVGGLSSEEAESCAARCVAENARAFRETLRSSHVANVEAFLGPERVSDRLYPRPGAAEARDGAAARARRLAPLALRALKLTGYSTVAYTYQLAETGVAAAVLSPAFRAFCESVVPMLNKHARRAGLVCASQKPGAMEAELALRLYYLGCDEALRRMRLRPGDDPADFGGEAKEEEEASSSLDDASLDALGGLVGAAQWLYAVHELRAPHDSPEWAAWYLSRLVGEEWTLLACVGASRSEDMACSVPSLRAGGLRFPAWCLAATRGRAVLAVRGSQTPNDWQINAATDLVPLFPDAPPGAGAASRARAHGGIWRAARAILADCAAEDCLRRLQEAGLDVVLVGHSLGGGVAAMMAALLNHDAAGRPREGPLARCVAYAPAACVDEEGDAAFFLNVLSCFLNDDIVPRLSEANCAQLAQDLVQDDANYRDRLARDVKSYKRYLATLGKAEAMTSSSAPGAAAAAAAGAKEPQEDLADDAAAAKEDAAESKKEGPPPPEAKPAPCEPAAAADDDPVRLVPPGRLAALRGRDGAFAAREVRHDAPSLRRIPVTAHAVLDHGLDRYALCLRSLRRARGREPAFVGPARFAPTLDDLGNWAPCAVCGSDVSWTSAIPGSDAARAAATHHCRACGEVVCTFCAPAADSVAADALGEFRTLPDRRTPLPSRGCLQPARVCRVCYFRSYDL